MKRRLYLSVYIITIMLIACNSNTKQKKRPYVNQIESHKLDSNNDIYSPIILDNDTFRDVWWQLKAPSLLNGRLSFYYKKPQDIPKPIECVSFGHNGLLLLHGAYSTGFRMASGLVVQDREIKSHPANYVFFGENGLGYIGYNWAEKSTNTDANTRAVLSFDSTGNVSILNSEGDFITHGNDRYQNDVSDQYNDRSKIDLGFANRTYLKNDVISSGTYTPSIKKVENISAAEIVTSGAHYTRIGQQVTVTIALSITSSASSKRSSFTISLPITSNFTTIGDCTGTINMPLDASKHYGIQADVSKNCAVVTFTSITNKKIQGHLSFTYTLL